MHKINMKTKSGNNQEEQWDDRSEVERGMADGAGILLGFGCLAVVVIVGVLFLSIKLFVAYKAKSLFFIIPLIVVGILMYAYKEYRIEKRKKRRSYKRRRTR